MKVREFLEMTNNIINCGFNDSPYYLQQVRPRIVCADGFEMSVQAGSHWYCYPRANLRDGNYSEVEVGYPSDIEPLIMSYAEGGGKTGYTENVYAYVPVDLIDEVLEKHGGIALIGDKEVTKE